MEIFQKKRISVIVVLTILFLSFEIEIKACTTIIIGRKATKDGSVIISPWGG